MIKYLVEYEEFHKVTVEANSKEEAIERVINGDYDEANHDFEIDGDVQVEPLE